MTYPEYFKSNAQDAYRWHLMKAMIESAGATVLVPPNKLQRPYVRNKYFQIGGDLFFGVSMLQGEEASSPFVQYTSDVMQFCKSIARRFRLNIHPIDTEQVNGGNFLYIPEKKAILFGCVSPDEIAEQENLIHEMAITSGRRLTAVPIMTKKSADPLVSYDIDLFVGRLPNGELLVYKDAIAEESLDKIAHLVTRGNIIYTSSPLNCNFVSIGNKIILPKVDSALKQAIQDRGYKVIDSEEVLRNPALHASITEKLSRQGYNVDGNVFNNQYTGNQEILLHFKANASFNCITNSISSVSPQRAVTM